MKKSIKYPISTMITISLIVWVFILLISLIVCYAYNDEHDRGKFTPHSYIYSFASTEYVIKDSISANELKNRLMLLVRRDSCAMYGYRETSYMSLAYQDSLENALESYSSKMGHNEGAGKGPRYYSFSFLIPYDNHKLKLSGSLFFPYVDRRFYMYSNKIVYTVSVLETDPVIVTVCKGVNLDEQRINSKLDNFFETNYLDKVCTYKKSIFWNWYFFIAHWCFYHLYFVAILISVIYLSLNYLEKYLERREIEKINDMEKWN